MAKQFLYEKLYNNFEFNDKPEIPPAILLNLPADFKLRDYQEEAIQYFIKSYETAQKNGKQIWNLFHMATGAGKTNIMAAIVLYLYENGYRNFIFFVNSVNIVEKTKENFLNKEYNKYLFNDEIYLNQQRVLINTVENFAFVDENSINIMFTTIQGLHDKLNTNKENSVTFSDFENKKVVLLADEAHHLNASTTSLSKNERDKEKLHQETWENTITKIYNENKENILLEFTATCDLKNKYVIEKYMGNPADIVYDYSLFKFKQSGYTKDLMNLRTTLSPLERTLQAMLLSQYRLKLFEKNGIPNSKPVILLKAHKKTENLDNFYEEFLDFIKNTFNNDSIEKIRSQADDIIKTMFEYYESNNIDDSILVDELKQAFSEEHIVKIHSKLPNVDKLQTTLNDLENPSNPIRMIMTLDMLHEGWDVLNLFDIVRLYDERQGGAKGSVSKATIQEAQLIGRGARYFPFVTNNIDYKYKRKYDNQLLHELRVCETMYYHCIDDSKYITEVKKALKETGFEFSDDEYSFEYKLKPNFKETKTYKEGKLFQNKQLKINNSDNSYITDNIKLSVLKDLTKRSKVSELYDTLSNNENKESEPKISKTYKISDVAKTNPNLIYKVMRTLPIYKFNLLKNHFPQLSSHNEFISSEKYAGRFEFTIETNTEPTVTDIYEGLLELFDKLSAEIFKTNESYIGTKEFIEIKLSDCIDDTKRKKSLTMNNLERTQGEGISQNAYNIDSEYRLDLSNLDWFVYNDNFGTTEEKRFVKYFSSKVDELKLKYDDVYLVRNERNFHIFSFDEGKRFEPDYILILNKNGSIVE